MRTIDLDWADLEIAFRDASVESYFDTEGGEVLSIVEGFDDEEDLRLRVRKWPTRFVRIEAVRKEFSTEVVKRFAAREKRASLRAALDDALAAAGGLSRAMAVLRGDKSAYAAFSRFEQGELLRVIETFLAIHNVAAATVAPSPELFEGLQ
jgi:hypothetical protein